MRLISWSLVVLCVASVCCAAPPKPGATAPSSAAAAKNGAIVIFERQLGTGDVQLAAQKLSADGKLAWAGGEGSVEVAPETGYLQRSAAAVRDGAGGAIIVFEAEARTGGSAGDCDLWAQRLDASGTRLWNGGANPVAVADSGADEVRPLLVPDGAGGVIVCYERHESGERVALLAQRLSGSGARLWSGPSTLVPDSSGSHEDRLCAAVSDGAGGAIVVYEVHYTSGEYSGDCDLHAQRISGSGALLWTEEEVGMTVSSGEKIFEREAVLVQTGGGGVIAVFVCEWRSGEYAGDWDIYAQRLSADGSMVWNDGDRSMVLSAAKTLERAVVAFPDGKGGVIAVFESEPREGEHAGDCDVYAQRMDADGQMGWNRGERSSSVADSKWGEKRPVLAADGKGGLIVVFEQQAPKDEFAGDIDIGAERISAEGKTLWATPENNRAVDVAERNDYLERGPAAISDGSGGAIVVYEAEARVGKYAGRSDLWAQRLGPDGKHLWNDGKPLTVAGSEDSETHPVIIVP